MFLCVFMIILYWDGTSSSSRGLGASGDGKTVKTLEEWRISTSFQRGIVLTCFAPACIEGEFSIEPFYFGANITRSEPRSASSYGSYSSRGLSLKSTQVKNPTLFIFFHSDWNLLGICKVTWHKRIERQPKENINQTIWAPEDLMPHQQGTTPTRSHFLVDQKKSDHILFSNQNLLVDQKTKFTYFLSHQMPEKTRYHIFWLTRPNQIL